MNTLILEPFVGMLPIRFGMTRSDVNSILGPPTVSFPTLIGDCEVRKYVNVGYSDTTGLVDELIALPISRLLFEGEDLYAMEDPIRFLSHRDPNPMYLVGGVFFLKLGIELTGIHDHDDSQRAITATLPGHWDKYKNDFEPFFSS